ncbi:hypothetical protein PVAP13_4KG035300 [Panicum virgatum]|uniref:Uncharacterized protein n=1 Tax=Panicum virgatum TaxID=38727 RepID=A0A8T0TCL6_PANVG|nr:hypothetical protein PVAP13_4KG035300 [Panicum virgatum]
MDRRGHPSLLSKLGLSVLTCNSALAVYQSHNDPASVAFVIASYGAMALLFLVLRKLETSSADREGRRKILAAVWALTTLLTAMFASKVAPLMPQFVAVQVWLMAAATAVGGFLAFFANL